MSSIAEKPRCKDEDECTELDTEEMQLGKLKTNVNLLDNLCFKLKSLFRKDKKAVVDFFYMYMGDIIKDWNNCEQEELAEKHKLGQYLLSKLRIRGVVDGITVCKPSDHYMSSMMFPLFVGIRYFDQILQKYKAVHIFKDIHNTPQVVLYDDCVAQPFSSKIELNEVDERFKKRLGSHVVLATKKRRCFF